MSKTLSPSNVASRDPKGLKAVSLFEAAYNKAELTEEQAQNLNESPEFAAELKAIIAKYSTPKFYASEEVLSTRGYSKGYQGPKPIQEQIKLLSGFFHGLSLDATNRFVAEVLPTLILPEGAEGWFAILRPEVFGTYNQGVKKVLAAIATSRKFANYREGQLGPEYLRQHERTVRMYAQIAEKQKGDILIIPGQLGKRHAGRSVRRARVVFTETEFGFGTLANGSILLAHPESLTAYEDLWRDCSGDEFSPDADGKFGSAPYFYFDDARLRFAADWVNIAYENFGSASGFLPQPEICS